MTMKGLFSRGRALGLTVATAGVALLSSAPAHAALISTDSCDNATLTQPFAAWGDTNDYKLVPGGSFEGTTAGWTFSGGAAVTSGSEPFGATGSTGAKSVTLHAGGTVTTPFTCVDAAYPTFRFFAKNGGLLSTVLVQVVYRVPLVGDVSVPVGTVALSGAWEPTAPMLTASAVTGLLSGGTAQVALRFTALTGTSQIDDIYVDPRLRW